MPASARPIISAEAVAAVRRGLRRVFWPASTPTVPKTRRNRAAAPASSGIDSSGEAAVTPSRIASTPAPTTQPAWSGSANRPTARAIPPSTASTSPTTRRRRSEDSGSATSSRSACTGAMRPVRSAGTSAATTVTSTATEYAATGVRAAITSG